MKDLVHGFSPPMLFSHRRDSRPLAALDSSLGRFRAAPECCAKPAVPGASGMRLEQKAVVFEIVQHDETFRVL